MAVAYEIIPSLTAATITLNSLAASATAGRQATAITFRDGSNRVAPILAVELAVTLTTGTLGGDNCVHLWLARSMDGTNYETGLPAVGASDAAYTFTATPVGNSPAPTEFLYVGSIRFTAQSQAKRKTFRVNGVPRQGVFVVLNNSGIALAGSGNSLSYAQLTPEIV